MFLGGGEDIEDAASHGELAATLDEVGAGVGSGGEGLDHVLEGHLLAGGQRHRSQLAEALGDRLEDGAHRCDDDSERPVRRVPLGGMGQPAEHREPLAHGVAPGAESLVRQGLPRREVRHGIRSQAGDECGVEVLRLTTGGRHGQHRAADRPLRRHRSTV